MTLREALEYGVTRLSEGPHPEKARRDAEGLLIHASGRSRTDLLARGEDEVSAVHATLYEALVNRRRKGEPIQYITGEAEFYGLSFHVTGDVLIPRPETEHLVESVLELARSFAAPRILDVGSGSGAIAVSLARHLPEASITAIDISPKALALAQTNAQRNGAAIRLRQGDLLAPVASETFDFIVSNPPYVPLRDRGSLSVEVGEYEPAVALFAGEDGLDIYRRLIPAARSALDPGGFVALEIGYGQQDAVRRLLDGAGYVEISFIPDLQGISRVAVGRRRSLH